jgi:glucosamine-6-phosphate deaminase
VSAPLVLADAEHVGLLAAELVATRVRARPNLRIVLPTGPTPGPMHAALRAHAMDGSLPTARVAAFALDEYLGLGRRDPVDLAVLGLGPDGHVWTAVGPRGAGIPPAGALTAGLRTLVAARELLLLATGPDAARALQATLAAPAGPHVSATMLRGHPRLTILCDRAAAALLTPGPNRDSDHVAVVLGHREPGVSAEHRISAHSRARLRHAAALCAHEPTRSVVLTGFTHTGGLSEAEQMALEWRLDDVPVVLEVAGRNTAENASRSLPLILAHGDVRRVTVVSSVWHLRVPYFFAPYRRYGLDVRFRPARPLGGWAHLVAEELGGMAGMRVQRAAAMREMRVPGVVSGRR